MLPADYVTDDAGTGFVHTAPGHGADDYNTFVEQPGRIRGRRHHRGAAYGRTGWRLFPAMCRCSRARASWTTRARTATPIAAVIGKLADAAASSLAGGWCIRIRIRGARRAPLIFRNTPQWFIAMDEPVDTLGGNDPA